MKWFYFQRQGDALELAPLEMFTHRPPDALPSDNPMTPWYNLRDHMDEEHVHVQAPDYETALAKAQKMVSKP